MAPRGALLTSTFCSCLALPVAAQSHWVELRSPPQAMHDPLAVYDARVGRTLLFNRDIQESYSYSMFEWNGVAWIPRTAPLVPEPRFAAAMTFDSRRGSAVLFGGWGWNVLRADTWEWDGTSWAQPTPVHSPGARWSHAMAFDAARQQVLLFGGTDQATGFLDDTWTWDGNDWAQMHPATAPSPRLGHALAYDPARQRIVLFGGWNGSVFLDDTWEWDGSTWTRRAPSTRPTYRAQAAMTYDPARRRVVMTGGLRGTGPIPMDVWEWDGATWTRRTSTTSPPPRYSHAMVYDEVRDRTVVFGGSITEWQWLDDTWLWDGGIGSWSRATRPYPGPHSDSAAVTDTRRNRVLMFGGGVLDPGNMANDTWVWNGRFWTELHPTTDPPPTIRHRMAYDSVRDQVVMYRFVNPPETWIFDGTTWRDAAPASSPPTLQDPAIAFDAANAEVVFFGGYEGISRTVTDRTWTWDGVTWNPRTPAHSPPARAGAAMAFDELRREIVLTGGSEYAYGSTTFADTWTWDGVDWTRRNPLRSPGEHSGRTMVFDAARGTAVLIETTRSGTPPGLPTLWEWDGSDWTLIPTATPVPYLDHGVVAFDPVRGRIMQFSGYVRNSPLRQTGLLTPAPAATSEFGTACPGSAGTLLLRPSGRPAIGDPFQLELVYAPPGSVAVLGLSLAWNPVPIGPCTIYHDPATSIFSGVLGIDTHGFAFVPLSVPFDSALLGITLYGQAGAIDPATPMGFVLSAGLRIDIGE